MLSFILPGLFTFFSFDSSFIYVFFLNIIISFLFNYRYFVGSFFYAVHFQVLSGIKITQRPRLYGQISSIIFLGSVIALVITNIKKMKEKYKEWKYHRNINVNLNEQQPYQGHLQFNNVKNNSPLLGGFQTVLLVGLILAGNITFWFLEYTFNDSKYFYKQFMFKQSTLEFVYNIVVPLIYLIKKKKMRRYFWKYVSDVMF